MGKRRTDPRRLGGSIAGPGGPQDRNSLALDVTDAVLLDGATVSLVENGQGGSVALAMQLDGRVNKTTDRARVLYLLNEDGAAGIVSELIGLASRMGPEFRDRLMGRVQGLVEDDAV